MIARALLRTIPPFWIAACLGLSLGPLVTVTVFSFNQSRYYSFPITGWTLKWYGDLFSDARILSALLISVAIGACAAVLATIVGTGFAFFVARAWARGRRAMTVIGFLPLFTPVLVLAVALQVGLSPGRAAIGLCHRPAGPYDLYHALRHADGSYAASALRQPARCGGARPGRRPGPDPAPRDPADPLAGDPVGRAAGLSFVLQRMGHRVLYRARLQHDADAGLLDAAQRVAAREWAKLGGQAAALRYAPVSRPSRAAARTTATRWAPLGDHLMRRRFPMRVLPMSSTQPSAREEEIGRPVR